MDKQYHKTSVENMDIEFNEKQKKQIESENQKLMKYIRVMREEKNKKLFWHKLFHK